MECLSEGKPWMMKRDDDIAANTQTDLERLYDILNYILVYDNT